MADGRRLGDLMVCWLSASDRPRLTGACEGYVEADAEANFVLSFCDGRIGGNVETGVGGCDRSIDVRAPTAAGKGGLEWVEGELCCTICWPILY